MGVLLILLQCIKCWNQGSFSYSMSKGAVLTMTYSIASYINDNIRCNCIPSKITCHFVDGFIRKTIQDRKNKFLKNLSKTQPIGRMGTPQEIADLALYLSSDEAIL